MLRKIMHASLGGVLGLSVVAIGLAAVPAFANDGLREIFERGTLRVGLRADKKPFGYRDTSGDIIGLDPEFAQDLADRLGVKLEKFPVTVSNREEFVQQGKIDLFSANMNDTPQRRQRIGTILPRSTAVGFSVQTLKSNNFRKWDQLRGQTICALAGSFFFKEYPQKYGINLLGFKGEAENLKALEGGRCRGYLTNDREIWFRLKDDPAGRWKDYEMELPVIDFSPYVVAVSLDQRDKPLGRFVAGVILEWHQTGRWIEGWKKWGLGTSVWLEEMHDKFKDPFDK